MVQAEPGYRGNVEPAGQWRDALPRRFAATASAFRREATRWHRQCGRRPRITPGPPIRRCRACALRWSPPCIRRQCPLQRLLHLCPSARKRFPRLGSAPGPQSATQPPAAAVTATRLPRPIATTDKARERGAAVSTAPPRERCRATYNSLHRLRAEREIVHLDHDRSDRLIPPSIPPACATSRLRMDYKTLARLRSEQHDITFPSLDRSRRQRK
jgi:hypothetical protein